MSYLSVRTKLAPVVTWRCDDASAGLVSSTGTDDLVQKSTGHLYEQTALVPGLVGTSTSVMNGTTSNSGFFNGTAGANTQASTIRSFELWFHPAFTFGESGAEQDHFLIQRHSASTATGYYAACLAYVSGTTAKIGAYWNDGTNGAKSSLTNSVVITKGSTYHLVCTYETGAAGITIYVNGQPVAKTDGTTATAGSVLNRMAVGYNTGEVRASTSTYFDEVSVYNYTLTPANVLALYNGRFPPSGMRNRVSRGARRPSLVR